MQKLRLGVFGMVADMPLKYSYVKVAMVKWAYRQPTKHGYCVGPDAGKLKHLPDDVLLAANEVLTKIHGLRPDMKHLSERDQARIRCNCDIAVAEGLLTPSKSTSSVEKRLEALLTALVPPLRRTQKLLPDTKLGPLLPSFLADVDLAAVDKPAASGSDQIMPRIISFDEHGQPKNSQEVLLLSAGPKLETMVVEEWLNMAEVQTKLLAARAKSTVHASIMALASATMPLVLPKVRLERLGSALRVMAVVDLTKGALLLPCLIIGNNLMETSLHPHAVRLQYLVHDANGNVAQKYTFDVSPELQLPRSAADGETLAFGQQHSPHLFWAMKRTHEDIKWNCEVHNVLTQAIVATSFQSNAEFQNQRCHGVNAVVEVPVITNGRTVRAGEELMLRWRAPPEKERKEKKRDWISDAKAAERKLKQPKARSLITDVDQFGFMNSGLIT